MWPAYRSSSPSSSPSFFLDVTYLSDSLTLAPRQKQIIDNNSSKNWNAIQVLQRTRASMNHWEGLNAMPMHNDMEWIGARAEMDTDHHDDITILIVTVSVVVIIMTSWSSPPLSSSKSSSVVVDVDVVVALVVVTRRRPRRRRGAARYRHRHRYRNFCYTWRNAVCIHATERTNSSMTHWEGLNAMPIKNLPAMTQAAMHGVNDSTCLGTWNIDIIYPR